MTDETKETLCVVTVTYGDRAHLLRAVLSALESATVKVDHVVIVNNGSQNLLDQVASTGSFSIEIINLAENTGSASGFKTGLKRAAISGCDLIWLLDDDNVPEASALERILAARKSLKNDNTIAFAALRLDREKYVRAATTNFMLKVKRNAFLGFTLFDLDALGRRRFTEKHARNAPQHHRPDLKKLGYGIYGGLLFHSSLLEKAGFPDERFFLYMDDTEYTTRLVQCGAQIYLVPESRIRDIDVSWFQRSRANNPLLLGPEENIQRIYYTVRNSCFLSKQRFVDNRLIFSLNIISYFCLLFIKGILAGMPIAPTAKRLKLIARATLDGLDGRLGCNRIAF
jgi:GT2 family glycosyltransferase